MKPIHRPALVGTVMFAAALALAALAAWWQATHNRERADEAFGALAGRVGAEISDRLAIYEYGLRSARGAVVSAEAGRFGREAYGRYSASREIQREFPGARGFGVVRRVAPGDEAAFVERARRDDWPDFAVRQQAPHDGERFVVELIEPLAANRATIGLDLASEPRQREAALAAMRSGQATLSAPIALPLAAESAARAFVLLLPIYRAGAPLENDAQREAATSGWIFAPLVIDEVLQKLYHDTPQYTLSLRDKAGADGQIFYRSRHAAEADVQHRLDLPIYGRTWEAELHATAAFVQSLELREPGGVALGVALVGALCSILAVQMLRTLARTREQGIELARRAAIVASSDDAIIGATLDGVVTDWNGGAERLFGHLAAEALGHRVRDLVVPDAQVPEEQLILDAVRQGRRMAPFDTVRRQRDGTLVEVTVTAAPILATDGRCVGFSKTVRDMREVRAAQRALLEVNVSLERRVAERTASLAATLRANEAHVERLARANEDLDSFAYIASHDLKSPLRGIDQLATWIAEDLAGELNAESQDHLRLMRSRIQRMEVLLDDLLTYLRAGRLGGEIVSVNTRELVLNVFDMAGQGKNIHFHAAENLPVLRSQKAPLDLVFRNLIGNAVKHLHKPEGHITVSARAIAEGFEFAVQDNGPGIPAEHHKRVFEIFQTLKPRDEVEGSGMGLALVKKAVASAGGVVTLESDGVHGCTFRFTWPIDMRTGESP